MVTYYVVVPFDHTADGILRPLKAWRLSTADHARRRAEVLAKMYPGVVAFAVTGDPASGQFDELQLITTIGEVDLDALTS